MVGSLVQEFTQNCHQLTSDGYYSLSLDVPNPYFSEALAQEFMVIAELKLASPSSGQMLSASMVDRQLELLGSSADALSVLTEPNYFQGNLSYLQLASKFGKPLLMKDFILHKEQVDASGPASAILLIKRFLTDEQIEELITYIHQCSKEVILEVDNEHDLVSVLDSRADILAINNRNLDTLKIDISRAKNLLQEYPVKRQVLAFSGYTELGKILEVKDAGAHGVLIGTHLSKQSNPAGFVQSIKEGIAH